MSKVIMIDDLIERMNSFESRKDVAKFIKKYRKMPYLPMIMVNYAEELIGKDKYDTAMLIYLEMINNKHLEYLSDEVTIYLRLGEYYINNGDIDKGKSYLIRLCEEYANYEESINFRELDSVWQRLKPYVADRIKPSIVVNGETQEENEPMTDDELIELMLEELGSGGIHSYLVSYGHRLEQTLVAAKRLNKPKTAELLELIKVKYFNNEMPKKLEEIEKIIYKNDWWFEEEYDEYYYDIEKELC